MIDRVPLNIVCLFIGFPVSTSKLRDSLTPMRARCGGGAAACIAGVLAAPDTQGSWRLCLSTCPGLASGQLQVGEGRHHIQELPSLPLLLPVLPCSAPQPQLPGQETLQPRPSCNQATVPRHCFPSLLLLPYSISARRAQLLGVSQKHS